MLVEGLLYQVVNEHAVLRATQSSRLSVYLVALPLA